RGGAAVPAGRGLGAMTRPPARGAGLLGELKAAEPAYPLYGRIETAPPAPLDGLTADRGEAGGAVVEAPLLERLGIAVGDPLLIGSARFIVPRLLLPGPDPPGGPVPPRPR